MVDVIWISVGVVGEVDEHNKTLILIPFNPFSTLLGGILRHFFI